MPRRPVLEVRGEALMTRADFDRYNEKQRAAGLPTLVNRAMARRAASVSLIPSSLHNGR